ncbi:MAG: carboxyl transferase domain-containing protein [Ferrovibrionaceae bacterium]
MVTRVLIANRGEVAIRIARACAEQGLGAVAVHSQDDRAALHVVKADRAVGLPGSGIAAYLDIAALVAAARAGDCDAVHPGYGFLSENAAFAHACAEAGLTFIGPAPEALDLFGDKARALAFAAACDVPIAAGSSGTTTLDDARAFLHRLGPGRAMMVKAVAGGGGRGMRVVHDPTELDEAWRRCASEAQAAFGRGDLYVEELIGPARHIEIQIAGDGTGAVVHLHDRECSAQRRHQKLIELAPSPWLDAALRDRLTAAALRLAARARYRGIGTVEFLVEIDAAGAATGRFVFIEMNPRLQVEHTVTEEITGIDLVGLQLQLASGRTLAEIGLTEPPAMRGIAVQLRVNMTGGGILSAFEPPTGAGIRVETLGYRGHQVNTGYDPLLAKLVVHVPSSRIGDLLARTYRALCEFQVDGVATNLALLQNLVRHADFAAGRVDTGFVERRWADLQGGDHPALFRTAEAAVAETDDGPATVPDGALPLRSPLQGRLVALDRREGDAVRKGETVAVIEAMKMEHVVAAPADGILGPPLHLPGATVRADSVLLHLFPADVAAATADAASGDDAPHPLETVERRRARLYDEARPDAIARLRRRGALTARERIALLCDTGSFREFGGLALVEGLDRDAPADGLVAGTALIGGRPAAVVAQDFSVFGGSAGHLGSTKFDRAVALALAHGMPLAMLLDGGGHRIQDGQNSRAYAHGAPVFHDLARLSGWVPVVAAMLGAGFAANTNYAGMADFVVMVRGRSTMGLAGPALVKAGTGEVIDVQALGGAEAQVDRHGLADLGVDNEEEAIAAVRRFLSYLPVNARIPAPLASVPDEDPARAEALLALVPANTRRSYDVARVIDHIADTDSVFALKPTFAPNIVTTFARLAGRPVGFVANQALALGGMLDAAACEKAARFIAQCDAFGLPLIYLIDVPGFSIGSEAERSALGRRSAKLLFELGHATVPRISVVLRKGYGLGYVAMAGGRSFDADASFAWPTAEICAMSVEGSVDVAYRADYAAAPDPAARRRELIAGIRDRIGPLQAAEGFGIDDLIDPRTTRARLIEVLDRAPARRANRQPPKYRAVPPI